MVPINYFAVILSAVASMIVGYLWYGPLFGKMWMELSGKSMDMMNDPAMKKVAMRGYAIQFVGSLLMAFVLAHAIVFAGAYLKVSGISAGLQGAFWNWIGFIAPATIGMVLWDGKPWKLWFINSGFFLVSLLVMGIILALWM